MKKVLTLVMALLMLVSVIGCAPEAPAAPEAAPVKTGLAITATLSGKDASANGNGAAKSESILTAVTVGDDGIIDACVIDGLDTAIEFDNKGSLATDSATTFTTKNELGADYGMVIASSVGKEWNEQAAAFAAYCVGKTLDEVKGMAVTEQGKAADADLASSCTVYVGGFIAGVEAAVNNAVHCGAKKGDTLKLTVNSTMSASRSSINGNNGTAEADTSAAAITMNGDTITGCLIDTALAVVNFDASGKIVSDLSAPVMTKRQIGVDYGMAAASSIGKEWFEQADGFGAYIVGKTIEEVQGIALTETTAPAEADLAATCTISIYEFQLLVAKAAN
ncbi:MAG: hypothetical protein IJC67_07450 [Clostridia bacterium]|nr:hypothetical protein [Clostridia bacterium]